MFIKCLLFLFILGYIDAQNDYSWRTTGSCRYPRIANGKVRVRPRSKIVKFFCNYRYEMVGNRYATCKNEQWDEPPPVCVRPGCPGLPKITNGIRMFAHNGAWMVAFCLSGHKLVGPPVMYCDGTKWNGTMPSCIDSTAAVRYSCDFEDDDLCGWSQDELHDFDWRRINRKTPSHYLLTGPSYDHTYGPEGLGHYMYIESTTRLENETARLLSPVYSASVTSDGCFSFFYHMFGKDTGGLRVYQKPDNLQLSSLLNFTDSEKQKYILFEQWGNLGDTWYSAVADLKEQYDSFQIVIEGIRGRSYTSDIAIDDVAVLHGENCTVAKKIATTPPTSLPASCNGRCDLTGEVEPKLGCSCTINCLTESSCCFDFIELCLFSYSDAAKTDDDIFSPASTTIEQPQTQKLVASTDSTSTTTTAKTTSTTTPSTTTVTTTTTTTARTAGTTTSTPKPTTLTPKTTRKPTTIRTIATKPTTRAYKTTTKSTPATKPTTTTIPTTTTRRTTVTTKSTTKPSVSTKSTTTAPITYHDMIDDRIVKDSEKADARKGSSGALKTAVITIVVLACLCAAVMATVCARSSRGQLTIARLRGTTRRDAEVRYLTADVDD